MIKWAKEIWGVSNDRIFFLLFNRPITTSSQGVDINERKILFIWKIIKADIYIFYYEHDLIKKWIH